MELPSSLRYTAEHAYVRPSTGDEPVSGLVHAGRPYGSIEAVKTVSELYSPLNGVVSAINPRLEAEPALVNTEPYEGGWIIEIRTTPPVDTSSFLDADAYRAVTGA